MRLRHRFPWEWLRPLFLSIWLLVQPPVAHAFPRLHSGSYRRLPWLLATSPSSYDTRA